MQQEATNYQNNKKQTITHKTIKYRFKHFFEIEMTGRTLLKE